MTPAAGRPPAFVPDPAFQAVKALVISRTGHHYYSDKDDLLWERIKRRLRETGCRDCESYRQRLVDPERGEAEWAALEAEITIGETFFFRYADQFAALESTILPELLERAAPERRLRLWSAGCATGAEPYSLAILLRERLGPELDGWRISVVGTDINETALAAARRGTFGRWALRTLSAEQRERWFVPGEAPNTWSLRPQYRSLVRFERHNLMSLLDGTSPLQFTDFDLILCRNVLIYFHPDIVNGVVLRLGECLKPGGWLLVGHAEPNPFFAEHLRAVDLPGTAAYRNLPPEPPQSPERPDPRELPDPSGAPAPASSPGTQARAPGRAKGPAASPSRRPSPRRNPPGETSSPAGKIPAAPVPEPEPTDLLVLARRLADTGDLRSAAEICRQGLGTHPMNPALHYYQGLVARAVGAEAEAEKAFRRTIYLDKSFVMAHYQLGLMLNASGGSVAGRHALANAARLARLLPADAVLPEGDGLTASRLVRMVREMLGDASRPSRPES